MPSLDELEKALGALTLTAALAFALIAFVLDFVRSTRSEEKRQKRADEQWERERSLLVQERDEWKIIAQTANARREEADARLERFADAFETAYKIVSGGSSLGRGK